MLLKWVWILRLALSIARTESGFRHEARSSHGAVGVFQLMPSTARRMGYNPYLLNEILRQELRITKKCTTCSAL